MKTLILGGVRSGKSRLAESLASEFAKKKSKSIVYIATANASLKTPVNTSAARVNGFIDKEMANRIETHKKFRPKDWLIVEEPIQLAKALQEYSNQDCCVIIDCLTLWITNLLMIGDGDSLDNHRNNFIKCLSKFKGEIFIVSNETGLGIMPLGELTRKFGDEAGITNQAVAAVCERVVLTVAGLPLLLKGDPL